MFKRVLCHSYNGILLCNETRDSRLSHDYLQRLRGCYGTVAAHTGVVEPQMDGRLHVHMCVYGYKCTSELICRVSYSPELSLKVAAFLESVCCTRFDQSVHAWQLTCLEEKQMPRVFEIDIPEADIDFVAFQQAAQMRIAVTNIHSHSSTCL